MRHANCTAKQCACGPLTFKGRHTRKTTGTTTPPTRPALSTGSVMWLLYAFNDTMTKQQDSSFVHAQPIATKTLTARNHGRGNTYQAHVERALEGRLGHAEANWNAEERRHAAAWHVGRFRGTATAGRFSWRHAHVFLALVIGSWLCVPQCNQVKFFPRFLAFVKK